MLILFIKNNTIQPYISFIYSLFKHFKIKIVFIKNKDTILDEIKKNFKEKFIFIDYFNDELYKIIKCIYNISIYYYSDNYSKEFLDKLIYFSEETEFYLLTQNDNYKYNKSVPIIYLTNENIKSLLEDTFYKNKKDTKNGFIVLANIQNEEANKLWNYCIFQIRQFHNNQIIIISDNTNKEYIKLDNKLFDKYNININIQELKNIYWIESEYQKAGEILPYYYLYKKKLFDNAMIIHDSTFLQKKFRIYTNDIDYLWHFEHHANDYVNEMKMLKSLNNNDLIHGYDAKKWYGCFGCQTIICYDFIKKIQEKYNIFQLLKYIDSRSKRMNFERIFSILCTEINKELYNKESIYGNILDYEEWGLTFDNYIKYNHVYKDYDLIKTWCGR